MWTKLKGKIDKPHSQWDILTHFSSNIYLRNNSSPPPKEKHKKTSETTKVKEGEKILANSVYEASKSWYQHLTRILKEKL